MGPARSPKRSARTTRPWSTLLTRRLWRPSRRVARFRSSVFASLPRVLPILASTRIQNGLADEIGTREDAIAKAAELAGMRTYAVVSLEPESDDLSDLVGLLSSSKMSNEDLIERLKELNGNGSQH